MKEATGTARITFTMGRNSQSARVQQKCGFHFLKETTYTTRYGTVEDSIRNVIYRQEWEVHQL